MPYNKYNKIYKSVKRSIIESNISNNLSFNYDIPSSSHQYNIDNILYNSSSDSNLSFEDNNHYINNSLDRSVLTSESDSDSECSQFSEYSDSELDGNDSSLNNSYFSDSSNSNNNINNDDDTDSFKNKLLKLIKKHRPTHAFCNDLLKLLHDDHKELPLSIITLLGKKSPSTISIKSGVQYSYLDFTKMLTYNLTSYSEKILSKYETINITMNIDGLPLYKSSSQTLWPILFCIRIPPYKVFTSAVTLSFKSNYDNDLKHKNKPQNLDFLNDTIRDLNIVLKNGIVIFNRIIKINLSSIICDAPAKSFLKQSKQFNGEYGCDKCMDPGEIFKLDDELTGRRIYSSIDANKRTDRQFRLQSNVQHHIGHTPLTILPINMIDIFPIDYMHCTLLGICRKIIRLWLTGNHQKGKKQNSKFRLSSNQKDRIDIQLIRMKHCLPSEFSRKTRPLTEIDRWKATELRLFLLYIGKIVLKDILPTEFYNHFLILSHALTLLISLKYVNILSNITIARKLLRQFIINGKEIYGMPFLVYNVHSLLHLVDDSERLGNLDSFSAFPFENYLQKLKKIVRGGRSPLKQIINYLNSENLINHDLIKVGNIYKYPNNSFLLENNTVCEILPNSLADNINYDTHYKCRKYYNTKPYYNILYSSIQINSSITLGCI